MILHELIIALLLGLIGGVIPGPVITAIFTEVLQRGFTRSLRITFLALLVESLVAVISLLILSLAGLREGFFHGLSLAGAAILVWIAVSIWKVRSLDSRRQVRFGTGKLILMILTNGVLWTYWITICIPKAMLLAREIPYGEYLFMGSVQLGWLISTLALSYTFSRFRRILSRPAVIPWMMKVFSLAFFYFAADMIYGSIRYFTG